VPVFTQDIIWVVGHVQGIPGPAIRFGVEVISKPGIGV
jgi:hypothetical protein